MQNSLTGEKNIYYDKGGQINDNLTNFKIQQKQFNQEAVYDFLLFGTILPPNTFWSEAKLLFPGENFQIEENQIIKKDNFLYKNLAALPILYDKSIDYYVNQLEKKLENYFNEKRNEGKAINLFLSGGIDSGILASYLKKDENCITWAGWGEKTTDYVYAQKITKAFGLNNHLVIYPDYDEDEKLFIKLVKEHQEPFKLTMLPYYKMAEKIKEISGDKAICITGDNADTVAGSFGEVVYTYKLSRLNKWTKIFPWEYIYNYSRKFFLLSTDNPVALAGWLHSNGIFPGPWIKIEKEYFDNKKMAVEIQLGKKINNFNDYILMGMLMTGVVRQTAGIRSIIMRDKGLGFSLPYCHQQVVELLLQVPLYIRNIDNFGKVILKKLAIKRGVPLAVINKNKKGMSYGYINYIKEKRHLPIWQEMERNEFINQFIDIKMIRQKNENNFITFDTLRSLHYYSKLNLKLK